MKLSIIVPVYNAGDFLMEAIKSIFENVTFGNEFEVLIVDDVSTDEVTKKHLTDLESIPEVRVLRQKQNGGPAKARNAGLRAATGEWIGFLDADDIMAPGTMAHRMKIISSLPEVSWLIGDILEIRHPGQLSHENHFVGLQSDGHEISPGIFFLARPTAQMLNRGILPVLGAMFIKKNVFEVTGLFDEELTYGEDIHFCLVLSTHVDLFWTPQPCLYLRRYHDSMTKDLLRGAIAMPKSSLLLLKDERFKPFRKQLRWQHAANLRRLSKTYAQNRKPIRATMSAILALRWVPNDIRNFKALQKIFFQNN